MLHVGYNTPYRIILLLLIKKFCQYQLSEFITYKFILFLTKSVLNESRCEETCSEPTLRQVIATIETFSDDDNIITYTIEDIVNDINALRRPERLENFLKSITSLLDNEAEAQSQDHILLQKECVFGLFIRKCHVEFESMPDDRFYDLFRAFEMYCSHQAGDNIFTDQQEERWISEHNIVTFLRAQAEMIEKTGQSSIHPTAMHNYLRVLEQCVPDIPYIHQMKYLNYALSKEHVQSLYHLHIYFDSSVNQGVEIQYALLNLGILEYKFGHFSDALFAFNDALTAARKNKDEYCLQEIQYWIETCRKNHYFQGSSSFTDDYLNNMKALTLARDMICKGDSNRHVFEILYKTSINIIMKDIEQMDLVQYLITALAWLRCGNSTLVSSYLELAKNVKDSRIEDIEKTVLLNAKMVFYTDLVNRHSSLYISLN
ncbi:hypothetical protein RMATCC62417_17877 [Rhizopus microsporus]|nr:hypothetical protein RMATCC62417_17877 [Rhizopus microsporus]